MLQPPDISNSHLQEVFAEYGGSVNWARKLQNICCWTKKKKAWKSFQNHKWFSRIWDTHDSHAAGFAFCSTPRL